MCRFVLICWLFIAAVCAGPLATGETLEDDEPLRLLLVAKMARSKNVIMSRFASLYQGIVQNTKTRDLHVIVMCEPDDVPMLNGVVLRINRKLASNHTEVEFIDIDYITSRMQKYIFQIRKHFLKDGQSSRFYDDLYHIGQVYHRIFPFKRLIALDLDLRIYADLALLEHQFQLFNSTQVIGLANDLTPHYWNSFQKYRLKNPGSNVGQPYPGLQGFNTGVLLLDLEKMRKSSIYNKYLDPEELDGLCEEYLFEGFLAYQDYFTLLGMKHPELFYVLNCTWNRQLDKNSLRVEAFRPMFDQFHRCQGQIKIYHGNAGWDIPENNTINIT